ncbi:MAG: GtrA family protein [Rhodocyclaceae bacterium]|nr:MAG: GtrA family protein [Rhodocyclaceae bacterium]
MTAERGLRATATELLRYLAVSAAALAVDTACLLVVAQFVHYLWAATLGFMLGAVTSYLLSVRWAFRHRRLAEFPRTEFAAFAAIGVIGLGLNNLVIYALVEHVGVSLLAAKAVAAGVTFSFNFGLRKWSLFRP